MYRGRRPFNSEKEVAYLPRKDRVRGNPRVSTRNVAWVCRGRIIGRPASTVECRNPNSEVGASASFSIRRGVVARGVSSRGVFRPIRLAEAGHLADTMTVTLCENHSAWSDEAVYVLWIETEYVRTCKTRISEYSAILTYGDTYRAISSRTTSIVLGGDPPDVPSKANTRFVTNCLSSGRRDYVAPMRMQLSLDCTIRVCHSERVVPVPQHDARPMPSME